MLGVILGLGYCFFVIRDLFYQNNNGAQYVIVYAVAYDIREIVLALSYIEQSYVHQIGQFLFWFSYKIQFGILGWD